MANHCFVSISMMLYRPSRQILIRLKPWVLSNIGKRLFVEPGAEGIIRFEEVITDTNLKHTPTGSLINNSSNIKLLLKLPTQDSLGKNNSLSPEIRAVNSDNSVLPATPPCTLKKTPLSHYLAQWEIITSDKWVLDIIRYGHTLEFTTKPPPHPPQKTSTHHLQLLKKEALIILQKGAIEHVPGSQRERFLLSFFPHPKEESGGLTSHIRPQETQQIPAEEILSHCHASRDFTSSEPFGFFSKPGSGRCLFPHSHSPQASQISTVLCGRHTLPVQGPSVRPSVNSPGLYKVPRSRGGILMAERRTNLPIPR